MNQLDRQVAQRLTRYYVLALTMVAILTLSGLWFMKRTIWALTDDGRVVNVAGRQRMLSQQLTKLAILRAQEIAHTDTTDFGELIDEWYQNQNQLREGLLLMEKTYVVRRSAQLDSMFRQIQPVLASMYTNFKVIATDEAAPAQKGAALSVILRQEPAFLNQMDAIVFQFDAESLARVRYLERIEWLLAVATLVVLLLEGLFVFRPVVGYTKKVIRMLTESEVQLKDANEQLALTNQELRSTQQRLLRTTEEKYQLQLAEETVRSAALLEGQEEERKRFARELHDGIGQMLTGLKLHVEKLRKTPFADEKQKRRVEDLRDLLQETIQNTREVAFNLMPSVLGDFGLEAALQLLTEQTARSSGVEVKYIGKRTNERLPPAQEIGLYRIAQEALNNAVKHADARQIEVRFDRTASEIRLTVEDNGKGFVQQDRPTDRPGLSIHSGLNNMKTRARLLNGSLEIVTKTNKGTRIEVKLIA
jgi:signal transduction histidine kinase